MRPGVFAFGPVPEEAVMSIIEWIIPGRAAGWATSGCESGWANR
jgi:hypothetical protein